MKVQPPIVVAGAENDRLVVVDVPKKAVPVGTAAGVQLAAVLKSPLPGAASQVASCARAAWGSSAANPTSAVDARSAARGTAAYGLVNLVIIANDLRVASALRRIMPPWHREQPRLGAAQAVCPAANSNWTIGICG